MARSALSSPKAFPTSTPVNADEVAAEEGVQTEKRTL